MPNHSSKKPKLPADVNQRGKAIVDALTRDRDIESEAAPEQEAPSEALRQAAAELGRRGGLKGGKARASSLTPKRRSEIAKKAAAKRWGKTDN